MEYKYKQTKFACYAVNASMSVVATLSPILFLSFRGMYGISFSMLGALVLVNFCTQLAVDLAFSFYSHKFNIEKCVKITPVLTAVGLLIYAVFPFIFPNAVYVGLLLGTVVFAASGGLVEVLISPVIAELPSENPEREMSKLHSIYAWGVVVVVIVSTLFLTVFGKESWQWLAIFWTIVPITASCLFITAYIPPLKTPKNAANVLSLFKGKDFILCVLCIFLGGASECTMAQWCSGYLEQALAIPKVVGDIFGVALFSVMLGLGRTLYSKYGHSIYKVLTISAAGATVCYIVAAFSSVAAIGLAACVLTGLCTAMLWPGSLLVASDKFPAGGVAVFALMAAGGDLGGAVGPQLVGAVTDLAINSRLISTLSITLNLAPEQLAMKAGLFSAVLFPIFATIVYAVLLKSHNKKLKHP